MHRGRKWAGCDHGDCTAFRQFTENLDSTFHRLKLGFYGIKQYLGEDGFRLSPLKGKAVFQFEIDDIIGAKTAKAVVLAGQPQKGLCCIRNNPVKIKAEQGGINFF